MDQNKCVLRFQCAEAVQAQLVRNESFSPDDFLVVVVSRGSVVTSAQGDSEGYYSYTGSESPFFLRLNSTGKDCLSAEIIEGVRFSKKLL